MLGYRIHQLYLQVIHLLFRRRCCKRLRCARNRNYHFHLCRSLLYCPIHLFFLFFLELAVAASILISMTQTFCTSNLCLMWLARARVYNYGCSMLENLSFKAQREHPEGQLILRMQLWRVGGVRNAEVLLMSVDHRENCSKLSEALNKLIVVRYNLNRRRKDDALGLCATQKTLYVPNFKFFAWIPSLDVYTR